MKDYFDIHYKYHSTGKDFLFYETYVVPQYYEYLEKKDAILDLGCGTGDLLKVLDKNGYTDLTGVDSSEKQIEIASSGSSHIKFKCADIIKFIDDCEKKFDKILLIDVLEHFDKKTIGVLLDKISKKLNAGGMLILKVPNADSPILGLGGRYGDFTHEVIFNSTSISMVLREANFKDITVNAQRFFKIGVLSFLVRKIVDFIIHSYLVAYFGKDAFNVILTANIIVVASK